MYGSSEGLTGLPIRYSVAPNYPNPFNSQTVIPYQISISARTVIRIYNIRGQWVKTIVDAMPLPGAYEALWNGTDHNGARSPSGIYIYTVEINRTHSRFIKHGKLTLIR